MTKHRQQSAEELVYQEVEICCHDMEMTVHRVTTTHIAESGHFITNIQHTKIPFDHLQTKDKNGSQTPDIIGSISERHTEFLQQYQKTEH